MNVIYYKIWADLWGNKSRTLQVALIIALGAFGVGLVLGGRNLAGEAANAAWRAGDPPGYKISLNPAITDEQLASLKNIKGIVALEGLLSSQVRWRRNPADAWQLVTVTARTDYAEQKLARWRLVDGAWPTSNSVAVEWKMDAKYGIKSGDRLELLIDERVHPVTVGGVIDSLETSSGFANDLSLYMARRRFGELFGSENYTVVQAKLQPLPNGRYDWALAEAVDTQIQERLHKLEIDSKGLLIDPPRQVRYTTPDNFFATSLLNSIFLILGIIGGVIVLLGILLVYNSVSAILTQQVFQIGVMKAIGARRSQIFAIYLTLILIYGGLACLIAVPLAAIGANAIKAFFLSQMDFINPGFQWDGTALVVECAVAFLSPLLASLSPLLKGANITVREAISTYGLGGTAGLLETLLARLKGVSYSFLLMIGNTFRNLTRVALMQVTLVGSGVLFVAVMGVRDAGYFTFDGALRSIHQYQINLNLQSAQRQARLEQMIRAQPGVVAVEAWNQAAATVRPLNQAKHRVTDQTVTLLGLPAQTKMYKPHLVQGRWLEPGDSNALALHMKVAANLNLQVGDWVTLRYKGDKESNWQIVGIFLDPALDQTAYLPAAALAQALTRVNRANTLYIQTAQTDAAAVKATVLKLHQFLAQNNISLVAAAPLGADAIDEIVERRLSGYTVLVTLLAIMAVVIAAVGGIGLSGVLSLSVLERTREIGVMRAIGASSGRIAWLFIGEGLIQGLLSWSITIPLGIPAAYFMTTYVLSRTLGDQLVYHFTPTGILLWLVIMVILSIVASWFPARNATRVSVRESLAYQ